MQMLGGQRTPVSWDGPVDWVVSPQGEGARADRVVAMQNETRSRWRAGFEPGIGTLLRGRLEKIADDRFDIVLPPPEAGVKKWEEVTDLCRSVTLCNGIRASRV